MTEKCSFALFCEEFVNREEAAWVLSSLKYRQVINVESDLPSQIEQKEERSEREIREKSFLRYPVIIHWKYIFI